MNYIDIGFITCIVVGFLCGLIGKGVRKIARLFTTIGCVIGAYFTCGAVFDLVNTNLGPTLASAFNVSGETVVEVVCNFAGQSLSSLGITGSILEGLVAGAVKVLVFYVECLALLLVCRIVLGLFGLIFLRKTKLKPIHTLGIFGLARTVIVTIVFFFPVIVFGPILKSADGIAEILASTSDNSAKTAEVVNNEEHPVLLEETTSSSTETESTSDLIQPICEFIVKNYEESKFLNVVNKVFVENKDKIEVLKVTVGDKTYNAYDEFETVPTLVDGANTLLKMMPAEGEDPVEAFKSMDPEELKETFANLENNPTAKAAVISVLNNTLSEALGGVTISEDVDLAKEGETFALVVELMDVADDQTKLDEVLEPTTVANVLANSDLALDLVEAAGVGDSISELIPEDKADAIMDELDKMLNPETGDPTISQEKYDAIKALIEGKE